MWYDKDGDGYYIMVRACSISLRWIDSPNESNYKIERAEDGINYVEIATMPQNTTSFTDGTVTPQKRYWYKIFSLCLSDSTYYSSTYLVLDVETPSGVTRISTGRGHTFVLMSDGTARC